MKRVTILGSLLLLVGCVTGPQEPIDISHESELAWFVGHPVIVRGIVSDTKCPSVNGIDMWALDAYRGQLVEATGVLESWTVTGGRLLETERRLGGPFATRGPGVFYRLKGMKFRVIEEPNPSSVPTEQ